jgi:hypothetical protein
MFMPHAEHGKSTRKSHIQNHSDVIVITCPITIAPKQDSATAHNCVRRLDSFLVTVASVITRTRAIFVGQVKGKSA